MAEDTAYSAGEKLAGVIGAVLFLALLAISVDLATGGRVFGRRKPCGCQDLGASDVG
jgi:hypothetical protein